MLSSNVSHNINEERLFLLKKNPVDLTSPVCSSREVFVIQDVISFFSFLFKILLLVFQTHSFLFLVLFIYCCSHPIKHCAQMMYKLLEKLTSRTDVTL
jgi:hypothetical protein